MSSLPRYVPHYTVDDYAQWKGDWELIDGVAIAMSPSPFGPHERVVSELSRRIGNELIASGCPCRVYNRLDWIINSDTVVRPDMMVVCGEQPARHLERTPSIAAEILSDSSRHQDLTVKRELYREHHVPHYLILDPDRRRVEWIAFGESKTADSDGSLLQLKLDDECTIRVEYSGVFD